MYNLDYPELAESFTAQSTIPIKILEDTLVISSKCKIKFS